MLLFKELQRIGCKDTSQQEKPLAKYLSKQHPQTLVTLVKMNSLVKTNANLDQGDVQQPLAVGEAEVMFEAEVAIETTAMVPWVIKDQQAQVWEKVLLNPGVLKESHLLWKVRMPVSTVVKMDTRFVIVSKILITYASIADNLDTSHGIAVKNLKHEAEAEIDLGEVAVEDKDVALFGEGEEKMRIIWERQLSPTLPRKKIPLRH